MLRLIVVSVASIVVLAGCGPRVVRQAHSVPASVQLDLQQINSVWVAGFLAPPDPELDVNTEAVRLLRGELRAVTNQPVIDVDPVFVADERLFSDTTFWRTRGEEYGNPLIVTGSVKLSRPSTKLLQRGRGPGYIPAFGRTLDVTVVLIDGTTGEVSGGQRLPRRVRYGVGRFASGLNLFFDLMKDSTPDWIRAIAARTP